MKVPDFINDVDKSGFVKIYIRSQDEATRMNMRRQMEAASAAGMKISQF